MKVTIVSIENKHFWLKNEKKCLWISDREIEHFSVESKNKIIFCIFDRENALQGSYIKISQSNIHKKYFFVP